MLDRTRVSRGDTLIEVLIAFTVFSLLTVGAMMVMNQGSAMAERSVQISTVRQEINSQAEALRFLHDSYIAVYQPGTTPASGPAAEWVKMQNIIRAANVTNPTTLEKLQQNGCPQSVPTGGFALDSRNAITINANTGKLVAADTYSQATYNYNAISQRYDFVNVQGLWIEAVRAATNTSEAAQSNLGYVDYHIMACWYGPGQDKPMTLGTIVRLYEPR